MNNYKPTPVNLTDIQLSKELIELTEKIAENVHDIWAAGRINEGWRYGEQRNDKEKTTPNLVPYECLSEAEKDYDRNTAMGTIKLIIKLGYSIKKNN